MASPIEDVTPVSVSAPDRMLHGFGWSTAYLAVTRASAIAAVPIVLHGLGADLYAVWVIAGALVMIQSLFDLGVASALVRYVALAAARQYGARSSVVVIARWAAGFYLLLSAAVFVPLWFAAGTVVELVHFVKPSELSEAVSIVRWAAVAFVLTNLALVAASVLQGIDRVGASYRDQTVGWLLYLPLLVVGMSLGPNAEAVGLAWVGAYAVQTLLLSRSVLTGVRALSPGPATVPSFREMLSFGGRWQVSAWADFATFQLPRFIAGASLSSSDLVSLDVAIRAGQFAVAPLFAFYPTVLPRAASLLARGGSEALRAFLQRFYTAGALLVVVGVCLFIPIEVPLLAVWTGRSTSAFSPLVVGAILIGTAAHASTGLLTSSLLARGDVTAVLAYKAQQLVLAGALLAIAAPISLSAVALAIFLSLSVPASIFNVRTAGKLGLVAPLASRRARWSLAAFSVTQVGIPMALVVGIGSALPPWQLLGLTMAAALLCLAVEALLLVRRARNYWRMLLSWSPPGASAAAADHLARK
jgi:O-antigen/teichoic acid export membrane protein